ncbi:MAG: glycoside hydrolase family 15 protein [Planctomyces sp.]
MSRAWGSRPVSEWLRGADAAGVRSLRDFLRGQGTLDFPAGAGGLYAAAAGDGADFEVSGYRSVWVRDNMQIAWALYRADDQGAAAVRCVLTVAEFYRRHQRRFTEISAGTADAQDPMNRPHIRFNGSDLTELPEKWAHAQNDALGYFLWLTSRLALDGQLSPSAIPWDVLGLLLRYWQRIEVWRDEDSGHWEEVRKVAASSIGCALAGLEGLATLLSSSERMREQAEAGGVSRSVLQALQQECRAALLGILPAECIQSDPAKHRRFDAALLFLIWPLDIVGDRGLEDRIIADVRTQLLGPHGIRRYPGDSYWCADYRQLLSADERTVDFSDNLDARDRLLRPGLEAQWCIFDPILSCIYGQRYQRSGDAGDLEQQLWHADRSLQQLTPAGGRFPQYRCPESWFCERGEWIPNDITPLLWTQGNLLQALQLLEENLDRATG